MEVTAKPFIEDNKTLLKEFPKVLPKPLSKGSRTIVEIQLLSPSSLVVIELGFIRFCQLSLRIVMII
jgi:hypothetical protein